MQLNIGLILKYLFIITKDLFYKENTTKFFKDRHYLTAEFSELLQCEKEKKVFCELGCGVGNALFPLAT